MTANQVKFTNSAKTTLSGSVAADSTTLTVSGGEGAKFPAINFYVNPATGVAYSHPNFHNTGDNINEWFYITVTSAANPANSEVMKVTQRNADTFSLSRTGNGVFSAGDTVEIRLTEELLDDAFDIDRILPYGEELFEQATGPFSARSKRMPNIYLPFFLHGPGSPFEPVILYNISTGSAVGSLTSFPPAVRVHQMDPGVRATSKSGVYPVDPGAFVGERWGGLQILKLGTHHTLNLYQKLYYPNTIDDSRPIGGTNFDGGYPSISEIDPFHWRDFHPARWVLKTDGTTIRHTYLTPADISGQENTATSFMQMPLRTHPFRYGPYATLGYSPGAGSQKLSTGFFYFTPIDGFTPGYHTPDSNNATGIFKPYDKYFLGVDEPFKNKVTIAKPTRQSGSSSELSPFGAAEKHTGEVQQGSIAYFALPRINLYHTNIFGHELDMGFQSTGVNFTGELVSISYNASESMSFPASSGFAGTDTTPITTIQIKNIRNSQHQDFSSGNSFAGKGGLLTNANKDQFGLPRGYGGGSPPGSDRSPLDKATIGSDWLGYNSRDGAFHGQRILPVPNAVYDSGESHQSNPDGAVFSIHNSLGYDHAATGFSKTTNSSPYFRQGFVTALINPTVIDDGTGGGSSTFTIELKVHGKLTATVGNRLQFAHSHLSDIGPEFSSSWVTGPYYKRDAGGVKNTGPGHTIKLRACDATFDQYVGDDTAWGVRDNGGGFSELHVPNTPYGSYQTINGPVSNVYIASHTTTHSHSSAALQMDTNHATRDDVLTVKVKPLSDQSVFLIKITGELHHDNSSSYAGMYLVCEHITDPQPNNSSTFKNSNDTSTANGCFQVGNMMHNQKGLYPCYNTNTLIIDGSGNAVAQYGEPQQSSGGTYSQDYSSRTNVTQGASTLVPDTWPNNNTTTTNQQPHSNQTTLYEGNTDSVAINTNAMRDQGCGFSYGGTTRIYPFTSSVMMHRPGVTGFIRYSIRTVEEINAGTVQFGATTNGAISNMIVEELTHPYGNLGFDIPGGLDTTQNYAGHEIQYDYTNATDYKAGPSN